MGENLRQTPPAGTTPGQLAVDGSVFAKAW